MPTFLLDKRHGRTTSTVECHHHPLMAYIVRLCRVWHAIISLGKHTPSGNVGCGIPSTPLEIIHGRTTLGVAYYHRPMSEHVIGLRRALHVHMALSITHGRMTSGVACHYLHVQHTRSDKVRNDMLSSPLGTTHGRTTLGVACHHRCWKEYPVR